MGSTIGADILADIVMTDLAEICIRIYLCTTMGTGCLADWLAALGTEHGLGIVNSSTIGACLTFGMILLALLQRLVCHHGLLWFLRPMQHLLGIYSTLRIVLYWVVIVEHRGF
jgi:hypothetical protein